MINGKPNKAHDLYEIWKAMKARCYNKNHKDYKHYGERGIKVCERWLNSFGAFVADVGRRGLEDELDRKDNDGDYCPKNHRWATRTEQVINSRVRKDNVTGLKGVTFKKNRIDGWWAYASNEGHQFLLYRGKDFFEACCARKSREAAKARIETPL